MKRILVSALFIGAAGTLALSAHAQTNAPNTVSCSLQRADVEFKGSCEVPCAVNALKIDIDGPTPGFRCDTPPRQVAATLKKTEVPGKWLGTMEGKFPEDPTRFEVIEGKGDGSGVAKLPFGWYKLVSMKQEADTLALTIAANNTLPPTADDIRILERAKALLANESMWNKEDTRKCPPNQQKLSLFCALTQATTEVSGGVHYRQPALQVAREVLNEVGGSRLGKHRLMDYNNHPDTTLAEVQSLLDTAEARLQKRLTK